MESARGVVLSDGEVVVKEYCATRLDKPKTDGFLVATNRRILFVGEAKGIAGNSFLIRETQVQDISGTTGYIGKGLSISKVILIIVLAISFFAMGGISPVFYLLEVLPIYMVWKMFQSPGKQFVLVIHARNSQASPLALQAEESTGFLGLFGGHAKYAAVSGPGADAEAAIREIGALVLDLQSMGDLAIDKWQPKAE